MKLFKKVSKYNKTPFFINKQWSFISSSASSYGIQISKGQLITGSFERNDDGDIINEISNSDGTFYRTIYSFVNKKYYSDEYSNLDSCSIHDECWYIGIPNRLFDIKIRPDTFWLEYDTGSGNLCNIRDISGSGVLVDYNNNNEYVGNIFYDEGDIIITNTGSYQTEFSSTASFSCSFKGSKLLYENIINCEVNTNEFNWSLNSSLCSGSADAIQEVFAGSRDTSYGFVSVIKYSSGSYSGSSIYETKDWSPYITTIGLYNDDTELLAIAKYSHPIKKSKHFPVTYVVSFDTDL